MNNLYFLAAAIGLYRKRQRTRNGTTRDSIKIKIKGSKVIWDFGENTTQCCGKCTQYNPMRIFRLMRALDKFGARNFKVVYDKKHDPPLWRFQWRRTGNRRHGYSGGLFCHTASWHKDIYINIEYPVTVGLSKALRTFQDDNFPEFRDAYKMTIEYTSKERLTTWKGGGK